jgi:hypothetical protein
VIYFSLKYKLYIYIDMTEEIDFHRSEFNDGRDFFEAVLGGMMRDDTDASSNSSYDDCP